MTPWPNCVFPSPHSVSAVVISTGSECVFDRAIQHNILEVRMGITERFTQGKAVAVSVAGFIKRHPRASIAVGVGLLITGPLLTGAGGESFFLNLVGLGIAALVVRRIMRANDRRRAAQARQANCRCHCHRQGRHNSQQGTQHTRQQGGNP